MQHKIGRQFTKVKELASLISDYFLLEILTTILSLYNDNIVLSNNLLGLFFDTNTIIDINNFLRLALIAPQPQWNRSLQQLFEGQGNKNAQRQNKSIWRNKIYYKQ